MSEQFKPLVARGWSCHLVVERLPEDEEWLKPLQTLGVNILVLRRPRSQLDLASILRVRRLCRNLRADILVCGNIHLCPLLGAALAGVRVRIWTKRAMNSHYELCIEPGWRERMALTTRLSAMLSTQIVAVSSAVKQELVDLGLPAEKLVVRLNPRRLGDSVIGATKLRATTRAALGYANSDLVFISVAHAVQVKGWDLLIRAFAQIAHEAPAARLLLVGGIHRPEETAFARMLKADMDQLGISDRVTFTGSVPDVPRFLAAGDIFVLPSRSEGYCNALVEAVEVGLPCVSTRVGVATDVIREGQNGLLVPRNDVKALTEAMRAVAGDENLRSSIGKRASLPPNLPTAQEHAELLAGDYAMLVNAAAQ